MAIIRPHPNEVRLWYVRGRMRLIELRIRLGELRWWQYRQRRWVKYQIERVREKCSLCIHVLKKYRAERRDAA